MALPANVSFGTVTGRFLTATADSPTDTDRDPEGIAASDLTIRFTPNVTPAVVRDASSTPPTIFALAEVPASVNPSGDLIGADGQPGIRLVATTGTTIDPSGWTWKVTLSSPTFPALSFSFALNPGQSIDLATVVQVPASPGATLAAWLQAVADANAARDAAQAAAASLPSTAALAKIRGRELAPRRSTVRQTMPSATAPARSWGPAGDASQIPSATYGKVIDVIAAGLVRVVGMPASCLVHPAGGYPNDSLYRPVGVLAPDQNGSTNARWWGIEFLCDSPQIEIWYFNRGGVTYRVWIDDLAVGSLIPTTVTGTAGNLESILIDFTAVGGMKERKIRFEATGWDLFGIGLPVPAGQSTTQYTISPTPARPLLVGISDSLFGGSGASTSSLYSIPTIIGELLGIDGHNAGIGGTGYVVTAGGSPNAAPQQAAALAQSYAATPPDIILLAHGHNDGTGTAAVTTAAQQTVQTLRAAFPNALIIGSGPLGRYPGTTGSDSEVALEAAIYAGVGSDVDAWIPQVAHPMRPWVWGTGTTASPTGFGNADFYIPGTGGDSIHWGDAGINYVAERFAREILTAIPR